MVGFFEKLKLLEERKRAYRERLSALSPEKQRAVEDDVWAEAAGLASFLSPDSRQKATVLEAQQKLSQAFGMVRSFGKNEEVTPAFMMDLHYLLLKDADKWNAGRYRRTAARWNGSTMIMSNWASIPSLMNHLCDNINANGDTSFYASDRTNDQLRKMAHNPVIRAIEAGYSTIATHPFADANKRIARLNMALILSRANHIPLTIHNKQDFVRGVENYCATHQPHQFVRTMLKQMDDSYDTAFHFLRKQERGGR